MINSKDLQILPIKKAKTIPAKWYHSKKIFDLENKMIFLKSSNNQLFHKNKSI